jgi:hypothetical protein
VDSGAVKLFQTFGKGDKGGSQAPLIWACFMSAHIANGDTLLLAVAHLVVGFLCLAHMLQAPVLVGSPRQCLVVDTSCWEVFAGVTYECVANLCYIIHLMRMDT